MFNQSNNYNENYAAKLCKLEKEVSHPNADRMIGWIIDGNRVWTNFDYKIGDVVVYFPPECTINKELLSYLNMFSKADMNENTKVKGYFGKHGRVKAIRLRGEPSEGIVLKWEAIESWMLLKGMDLDTKTVFDINIYFDNINNIELCRKYIPPTRDKGSGLRSGQATKKAIDSIVDGQFYFHYSTSHLKKHLDEFKEDDYIVITRKLHGTSAITGNLLVKRELSWFKRVLKFFNMPIITKSYDYVISSRKVVKSVGEKEKNKTPFYKLHINTKKRLVVESGILENGPLYTELFSDNKDNSIYTLSYIDNIIPGFKEWYSNYKGGFYKTNVWKDAFSTHFMTWIPKGYTFYYEIVGFTKDGSAIQKGYDYKCEPNTYECYVYRVTITNEEGQVHELDWESIKGLCQKYDIKHVPEVYTGTVRDYLGYTQKVKEVLDDESVGETLLRILTEEYLELDCDLCNNVVPDEGICVRKESNKLWYKLKSFRFIERETKAHDVGEIDIETQESEN